MRTLHGAQMTYASTYGNGNYAGALAADATALSALATPGLVDSVLGSATKAGYNFVGGRIASSAAAPAQFFFSTIPASTAAVTATGSRRFCVATDGVIMADQTTGAQFADTPACQAGTPLAN